MISTIIAVARTRYQEFVRSDRFFMFVVFFIVFAYMLIPSPGASYTTVRIMGHRGYYDSLWIAYMLVIVSQVFLLLIGYYFVNNSLKLDTDTATGQIVATTPVRGVTFLLGKLLSNFYILATVTLICFVVSVVMVLVIGEDSTLELGVMIMPFVVFMLPSMFFIAAIGLFFEAQPFISRGVMNVLYFFLSLPLIMDSKFDALGFNIIVGSLEQSLLSQSTPQGPSGFGINSNPSGDLPVFVYEGLEYTTAILVNRLIVIVISILLVLLISLVFNRFNPDMDKEHKLEEKEPNLSFISRGWGALVITGGKIYSTISSTIPVPKQFALIEIELKMILKGQSRLFYMAATGIILGQLLSPIQLSYGGWLWAAWILPVLSWSKMGHREIKYRTDEIIFSVPNVLKLQFPSAYLAGALSALILASGTVVRLLISGMMIELVAVVVGAFFISSLAFFLQSLTRSSVLFEFVYLTFWYLMINGMEIADYTGTIGASIENSVWVYYLIMTILMAIGAFVLRKRKVFRS